jgi:hypothetical protein
MVVVKKLMVIIIIIIMIMVMVMVMMLMSAHQVIPCAKHPSL